MRFWDGFWLVIFAAYFGIRINFLVKHTLFKGVFGPLMRAIGGIAVDRGESQNLVGKMAGKFQEAERLAIAFPPEGTRRYVDYWKSGFYHVAVGANVPIVLGFLDYGRNEAGLGHLFYPTGDVGADMDEIRAFYQGMKGRYPEKDVRIRLRQEDPALGKASGS